MFGKLSDGKQHTRKFFSKGCIASPLYLFFMYTSGTRAPEVHSQKSRGVRTPSRVIDELVDWLGQHQLSGESLWGFRWKVSCATRCCVRASERTMLSKASRSPCSTSYPTLMSSCISTTVK